MRPLRALTLIQPWAWLVVHGGKRIENRGWSTQLRGEFLVHAAKGMTREQYYGALAFTAKAAPEVSVPPAESLERGGIVGVAEIFGVLPRPVSDASRDGWRMLGQFGFQLRNVRPLPFLPCRGLQRWWGNFEVRDGHAVQL